MIERLSEHEQLMNGDLVEIIGEFVPIWELSSRRLLLRPNGRSDRDGRVVLRTKQWTDHNMRDEWWYDGDVYYFTRAQAAQAVYNETRPGCTEEYHDMDVCEHQRECGCPIAGRTICAECMPEW